MHRSLGNDEEAAQLLRGLKEAVAAARSTPMANMVRVWEQQIDPWRESELASPSRRRRYCAQGPCGTCLLLERSLQSLPSRRYFASALGVTPGASMRAAVDARCRRVSTPD